MIQFCNFDFISNLYHSRKSELPLATAGDTSGRKKHGSSKAVMEQQQGSANSAAEAIELFKVGGSSAIQLSNQSDTPEVLYNLFLRIKTGVPL